MPPISNIPPAAAQQFRADIATFRTHTGLSLTDMTRATGLTWAGLHYIANGRRSPNPDSVSRVTTFMNEYMRSHPQSENIERDARGHPLNVDTHGSARCAAPEGFIVTRAAKVVIAALDYCARRRLNGAVFGDPGVGKSEAMRHWSAGTKFPHLVIFCRAYTSYSALLRSLARALGMDGAASIRDLDDAVHEELAAHPRMLVLDEADMLGARTLDWLRTLWDESGRQSNFMLFAKPAFYQRLQTAHARSKQDLRQVWRRLAFRKFLDGIDDAETLEFLASRGMADKLEPGAAPLIQQAIGGSFGDLDMLVEIMRQMLDENPKLNGRITPALVEKAREVRFGADILHRRRR